MVDLFWAHTYTILLRRSVLHLALVLLVWGVLFCVVVGRLLQCAQHVLFQSLLFQDQAILVPNEVWRLQVEAIALHARVEQVQNVSVIRVIREAELAAVAHELLEFLGLVLTELLDRHFLLFALDIVVLLVFGASG